jgi:NAD(P)-dependent dehydrogenase (short-subunit alcohol dehydrogenase family)
MQNFLITGATGGIGAALAEKLRARGANLALTGRSVDSIKTRFPNATVIDADLIAPNEAARVVQEATAAMGSLDCVIHLAGIGLIKSAAETTDAEFSRVVNVNLRASFLVAQAACKIMAEQKHGLFITVPGILGKAVMKNAAAYSASKFAVAGLIKSFAQEYARSGIRFSLLFLGGVDSPFWDHLDMKVQREKMIPCPVAADLILQSIDSPPHLVLSEIVMQPESHQLV